MTAILIGILTALAFPVVGTLVVDHFINAPTFKDKDYRSDHYDGKTFSNLDGIRARGLWDVFKWAITEDPAEWKELTEEDVPYGQAPPKQVSNGTANITFINHATFLIQAGGLNILTDPVWSLRASPFQWIGPKRMRPPGIRFEDLPKIDLVLLSHNHYDHLDIHTVQRLKKEHHSRFIMPLGVSAYLHENGIMHTDEMDWWEDLKISDSLTISSVPAQHFSGRGLTDRDKTLWCGFVLQTDAGNIYFAGDTGYDGFFKKIGAKFDPIDLAIIPIGAYRPRWFMEPIHVDPNQAVQIHHDIRARQSIGMHFGTFPLADEGMFDPVEDLKTARKKHGLADNEFFAIREGSSMSIEAQSARIKRSAVG